MTPDYIRYANSGAIRNQPLSPGLIQALSFLPDLGLAFEVFSGGQPRIGTSDARVGEERHDDGHAADGFFYRGDERLSWENPEHLPIIQEAIRRGRQAGMTGIGAGPGYMQPGSIHLGVSGPVAAWGAGGKGANAPEWLRQAFGATAGAPMTFGPNTPRAPQGIMGYGPTAAPTAEAKPTGIMAALGDKGVQQALQGLVAPPPAPEIQQRQVQAYQPVKRDTLAPYIELMKRMGRRNA